MSNRRRGAFGWKPDLTALVARLRALRLPRLSRKNHRRMFAAATPPSASATEDLGQRATSWGSSLPGARPKRSLLRIVLGFLAFAAPLAAALVAFTVPVLGVRAYEYVMKSSYFQVHTVVVDAATAPGEKPFAPHHTRDELLEIAGIDSFTQVLDADLDTMSRRLAADPWIRWAKVERELPDRLVIHVVEHRPTAYLAVGDLYLVDELGVPFSPAPADLALRLPFISGIEPERLADPTQANAIQQQLSGALNILQIWAAQGLAHRYPVGELRLGPGGGVAVILEGKTAGNATEIVIGRAPFREKLFRAEWILEHLRSLGKTADYILLDLADDADALGGQPMGRSAIELGGARVVVKTDLGTNDTTESHEPGSDPPTLHFRPAPEADQPVNRGPPTAHSPAPAPTPAHAPPPTAPAPTPVPNPPAAPADNAPGADADPNEAAPVSGGRPATDPGQE